jgi:hypothetical protein
MTKYPFFTQSKRTKQLRLSLVVLIVAIVGTISLVISHAATPVTSTTADSGTLTGGASIITDTTASDGRAVVFGGATENISGVPAGISPGSVGEANYNSSWTAEMVGDGVKYYRTDTNCTSYELTAIQAVEAAGIQDDAIIENPCAGNSPADYAAQSTAVVNALKPYGVHIFEIMNEPNCNNVSASDYTAILKASYVAIKAAYPSATVLTGGLCSAGGSNEPYTYLTAMYAAGAQGYFDAANVHPYSFPDTPLQTSDSWNPWSYLEQMHQIMADNGDGNKQIWLTEFGCPTGTDGGYPADCTDMTEGEQITEAFTQARQLGFIGPLFIYSWQDSDSADGDFGLYNTNGTAKQPTLSDFISAAQ